MSDGYNQGNDPRTSDSNSAQNAGNTTSQQNQGQQNQGSTGQSGAGYGDQGGQGATGQSGTGNAGQQNQGLDNADEARGGPPTGENVDDTGGLTSDEGARTGGMQQDAIGSAQGSELDDASNDTLEDQNSSGAV